MFEGCGHGAVPEGFPGSSIAVAAEGRRVRHPEKIKIPALLVYGSVFVVAPRVTYNEYASLDTP